jgi:hypothetical protein
MWHYGITQSQDCNDDDIYSDDNVWCVQASGLNSLVAFFVKNPWYIGGKHDTKERYLNHEHPSPMVSRQKVDGV